MPAFFRSSSGMSADLKGKNIASRFSRLCRPKSTNLCQSEIANNIPFNKDM